MSLSTVGRCFCAAGHKSAHTVKAWRDQHPCLTQSPLLLSQRQTSLLISRVPEPIWMTSCCIHTEPVKQPIGTDAGHHIDITCCFWHISGSADAAAGKLNMLPSDGATELLSSHHIFHSIFSRIEKRISSESIITQVLTF